MRQGSRVDPLGQASYRPGLAWLAWLGLAWAVAFLRLWLGFGLGFRVDFGFWLSLTRILIGFGLDLV